MKYASTAEEKVCQNRHFERNVVWTNATFGSYCNKRVVSQGREGSQYNVIEILLNLLDVSTAKRLNAWITRTLSSCTALSILCSTTWRSTCSHLVTWSPNSWPQPSDPSFPASLHTHTHTHTFGTTDRFLSSVSPFMCVESNSGVADPGVAALLHGQAPGLLSGCATNFRTARLCSRAERRVSSNLAAALWHGGGLRIRQNRQLPKARHGAGARPVHCEFFLYLINVHVFVKQHKLVDLV